MSGHKKPLTTKARLFRAIHAEGPKRGFDHDGLRDLARQRFGVHSMSELSEEQLMSIYKGWTGKGLKRVRKRVDAQQIEMVSGAEMQELADEFAKRGWGPETRREFIRRQLGGKRDEIRTRRDWYKVFAGVRAMNRRERGAA